MFAFGQKGWHPEMKDNEDKHLTIADYAATYFAIRKNDKFFNPVLLAKTLMHQFAIELCHMI